MDSTLYYQRGCKKWWYVFFVKTLVSYKSVAVYYFGRHSLSKCRQTHTLPRTMAMKQLHQAEQFVLFPTGGLLTLHGLGIRLYASKGAVAQPTHLMIGIDRDPDDGLPGFTQKRSPAAFCSEKIVLQSLDGTILCFNTPIYIWAFHTYSIPHSSKVATPPKLYCRQGGPSSAWKEDCGFMSDRHITVLATKSHCEFCLVWYDDWYDDHSLHERRQEDVDDGYLPSYEMNVLVYGQYHPCAKSLNLRVYVVKGGLSRKIDVDKWERRTGHFMGHGKLFMKPNEKPVSIRLTIPQAETTVVSKELRYRNVSDEWGKLVMVPPAAYFIITLKDLSVNDTVKIDVEVNHYCEYRGVEVSEPHTIEMEHNLFQLTWQSVERGNRKSSIYENLLNPYWYEPPVAEDQAEKIIAKLKDDAFSKLIGGSNVHDFSSASHTIERQSAIVKWLLMSGVQNWQGVHKSTLHTSKD